MIQIISVSHWHGSMGEGSDYVIVDCFWFTYFCLGRIMGTWAFEWENEDVRIFFWGLHVPGPKHVNGRMRMGEIFFEDYMFQMIKFSYWHESMGIGGRGEYRLQWVWEQFLSKNLFWKTIFIILFKLILYSCWQGNVERRVIICCFQTTCFYWGWSIKTRLPGSKHGDRSNYFWMIYFQKKSFHCIIKIGMEAWTSVVIIFRF